MAKTNPWGPGGPTKATKGKKKGIGSRAAQNVRDLLSALTPTKLVPGLVKEAAAAGRMFQAGSPEQQQLIQDVIKAPGIAKKATAVLDAPGVRLVPGTYVASESIKGHPLENPVFAALDVLPYVGKATKGATLATKPGLEIASRAATRAELLGNEAKVAKIASRGLEPRQVVGEALRSAEDALVSKVPRLERFAPTRLLELSGVGGARLRTFLTELGVADRQFQTEAKNFIDETMDEATQRGISHSRVRQITQAGELQANPGWRESLTPTERDWLQATESRSNQVTQEWLERGKLFEHDGEIYPVAGNRNLQRVAQELQTIREGVHPEQAKIAKRSAQLERQAAKAMAPLSRSASRKAGTYGGKTFDELMKARQRTLAGEARLAAQAEKKLAKTAERAVPARYMPKMRAEVQQAIQNITKGSLDPTSVEQVLEHYLRRNYADAADIIGEDTVKALRQDLTTTWQDMRNAGYDPIYLPHVRPSVAEKELLRPKLTRTINAPGQVKKRTMNPEPYVQDFAVGVSAQGVEHLRVVIGERLWGDLREKGFLKTREEAIAEVRHLADADTQKAIAKGADPTMAARVELDKWLNRMYGKFAPESIFPSGPGGVHIKPGEWYLPKGLQRALTGDKIGLLKQADLGKFAKVAGLPMNIFRMSILTLSPAYYVGNLVSGAAMLAAHRPSALLMFPKAIKFLRSGEVPKELSLGWREGTAEAASRMRRFKAHGELAKLLDDAEAQMGLPTVARRVGEKIVQVPQWLQNVAAGIDDMYKVMGFLSGKKGALKKGFSEQAAHQSGIQLAHKVLVDFDRLTPLERTAIRSVVPFYSWTSHLLRYVMSYPFDHPVRAAIVTALARNISEEWPEGLPERFKKDLFFDDDTKRLPLTNYFPMMGVPDLFSISGLFSRLNPALQLLMEYSGSDPFTYAAPVFGARQTEYDPVSGREVAVRPSLTGKVLELSPQAHQIWAQISKDPEWVSLVESNPEAARAAFWRAFGITIPRTFDMQAEIAKAQEAESRVESKKEREKTLVTTAPSKGGSSNPWAP